MSTAMLDKWQDDLRKASYFEDTGFSKWKPLSWSKKARSFLEELYREVPGLWPLDVADFENLTENCEENALFSFFLEMNGDDYSEIQETLQGFCVEMWGGYGADRYYPKTKQELFELLRELVKWQTFQRR